MKVNAILDEEFKNYIKSLVDKKNYAVHKNPSKKEVKEISEEDSYGLIRFVVDLDNENIYIFPGSLLHDTVINKMNLKEDNLIRSEGFLIEGKIKPGRNFRKLKEVDWLHKYLLLPKKES